VKIITINLPEKYLEAIQTLNDLGVYPSRSEAIRTALSEFLDDELKMFNNLEEDTFKMLVRSNKNNRS
jgi:Arc/MetJ-type ribon-helix-helix transcriptional regulator